MQLSRGQRSKLADIGLTDQKFAVAVEIAGSLKIDLACFGLDAGKKLSDERYMTFFNQPNTPCGAVQLAGSGRFEFDLARLPATIESLTTTLAIDGAGEMNRLGPCTAVISGSTGAAATYAFDGSHFSAERAIMLLEFYRKDGQWRMCAVGQGFNGGLDALVTHFGGAVAEKPAPALPTQAPPPPPSPKVSLSKITLEKKGDKISLEKRGSSPGHGKVICNLNWTSGAASHEKKGFLGGMFGGGGAKEIDLDLGCLVELMDGRKTAVQALGETFGSYDQPPYVHMTGDDRTGENAAGEFLFINGDHLQELKRVCVYAFIYEGVANWAQADGVVTVTVPGHPPIEVRLDNHAPGKKMCAVAMLEYYGGQLHVTKLAEYFSGHMDLDQRYHWGLQWRAGSK